MITKLKNLLTRREAKGAQETAPTGPVRDWIIATTPTPLETIDVGPLNTTDGKIAFIDPLAFSMAFDEQALQVPTTDGDVVVFRDTITGRNSRLALVFSDTDQVTGGAHVGDLQVGAGMASVFTATTHAATAQFYGTLPADANPYDDYFDQFDSDEGSFLLPPGVTFP